MTTLIISFGFFTHKDLSRLAIPSTSVQGRCTYLNISIYHVIKALLTYLFQLTL
jgi:hypothetical protein